MSESGNDQREFRCDHCDGKILIPADLPPTTGPCPHCSKQITSPAREGPDAPEPTGMRPAAAAPPTEDPAGSPAVAPPASALADPVDPEKPGSEKPGGVSTDGGEADSKAAEETPEEGLPPLDPVVKETGRTKRNRRKTHLTGDGKNGRGVLVPVLVVLLVLAIGVVAALFLLPKLKESAREPAIAMARADAIREKGNPKTTKTPRRIAMARADAIREKEYLEKGWEADARELLTNFQEAKTVAGKAAHSIGGTAVLPKMEEFYKEGRIDDSDTPAEAFAVFPLTMEDRKRGIFMMVFDQPPVFEIAEFFAPLAPLRVQYGLEQPDLLLAAVGRRQNFTGEPVKVHALFKRGLDGLRVDWETFVQTKYRTFRDFLEIPDPGKAQVFRVIMSETVPENTTPPAGHRTYLIADPAYSAEDRVRVHVDGDSEMGRALSILNWRGTKDARPVSRTATVRLRWSEEETPRIELDRFICWEFLGVGGKALPSATEDE